MLLILGGSFKYPMLAVNEDVEASPRLDVRDVEDGGQPVHLRVPGHGGGQLALRVRPVDVGGGRDALGEGEGAGQGLGPLTAPRATSRRAAEPLGLEVELST